MNNINKLVELYQQTSKHSNYQILPNCLKPYLENVELKTISRYERERFDFIKCCLSFNDKTVLDIGGNTGYFSFEAIDSGARTVTHVEGNKEHSSFVKLAAETLGLTSKINTQNRYYTFSDISSTDKYDIVLLLNVLHHIGDDYGSSDSIESVKKEILKQLNSIAKISQYCVFQLGYNWKGNRDFCLFEHGTKQEVIDFIETGIKDYYQITDIGIAQRNNGNVKYDSVNNKNIVRDNSLGEFLNRPLFVLKSKML